MADSDNSTTKVITEETIRENEKFLDEQIMLNYLKDLSQFPYNSFTDTGAAEHILKIKTYETLRRIEKLLENKDDMHGVPSADLFKRINGKYVKIVWAGDKNK